MKINRLLLITVLICVAPVCFATWTWRNPSPTGNDLLAVAYSGDYFIFTTVDRDGSIFISPDGTTWNEAVVGNSTAVLTGVGAGGGVIVAVGGDSSGNAVIYTSLDGSTWQKTLSGASGISFLNAVAYGNNEFVAVGINGTAAMSTDGINWVSENSPLAPNSMNGIAYGADPGAFVVAGNNGAVYYSTDGMTWNAATSGTTHQLNAVAYGIGIPDSYGSGYFVIVGNSIFLTSFLSSDVSEYSTTDPEDSGDGVTYDGVDKKFVTTGSESTPAMLVATNGTNWSTVNSKVQPPAATAIAYGNGKFVAVGSHGLTATSIDASNWVVNATSVQLAALTCGVHGANLFVAGGGMVGGNGSIYTSPDGKTWTPDTSASTRMALNGTIPSGFIYTNNQFIGVATDYGANGITAPAFGLALISPDGINWTTNAISSATPNLTGIAAGTVHGGTTYVAVGIGGSIFFTTDHVHWAARPLAGTFLSLNGVTFGNGKFVAVGMGGLSAVSTDGQNWTTNNYSKLNTNMNAVVFGNNQFVAVGGQNDQYGVIFTSPDGLNWTQRFKYITGITYQALNGVTFFNDTFVACGGGGVIYASPDGINWMPDNSGTLNNLTSALFGAGQYLVLGGTGTILGSNVLLLIPTRPIQLVFNVFGGASFDIMGVPGQSLIVETSTDLQHWSILETATVPPSGKVAIMDPDTSSPVKYYRAPYLP